MSTPAGYWRGYLPGRKVAHLLSETLPGCRVSECNIWAEWWGTGSQEEYERAADLPLCKRCLKEIGEL